MKTLKLIITNLIMILALIILSSNNISLAETFYEEDFKVLSVTRDHVNKYVINFQNNLSHMHSKNNNTDLKITIYDMFGNVISNTHNRGISYFRYNGNYTTEEFTMKEAPIFKYGNQVKVRISAPSTGLDFAYTVDVEGFDNFEDLSAKLIQTDKGKASSVQLYNSSNESITIGELAIILGFLDENLLECKLYAGDTVIDSLTIDDAYLSSNEPIWFKGVTSSSGAINQYKNTIKNGAESMDMDDYLNYTMYLQGINNHFKLITEKGDQPLSIGFRTPSGEIVKKNIETPDSTWFEALYGISYEEYKELYDIIEKYKQENVIHVTDDTKIDLTNKASDYFYVDEDGVYYVYVVNDLAGSVADVTLPKGFGAELPLAFAGRLTGEKKGKKYIRRICIL